MQRTLRFVLSCCFLVTALPAQNATRPDPDGRRLAVGMDSLAVFVIQGRDTVRSGFIRDELRIVRDGNREVLRRVYHSTDRLLGSRTDTLTDLLENLRPVRHRSHSERSAERIDFTSGRARGWLRLLNGDSVTVDAAVSADAYNSSSFDLVLRASSLQSGWQTTVPTFVSSARANVPMTARVAGEESVGGEICWRVQTEFGGTPVTFWISKKSRRLVKQIMMVRPEMQILFRK